MSGPCAAPSLDCTPPPLARAGFRAPPLHPLLSRAVVGTYASAITIVLAAVVLGRGICVLSGLQRSEWVSPAVGFAALMVVCDVAVNLLGRGWTAVAAVVLVCAASVWITIRRHAGWPSLGEAAIVSAVVLVFLSIPFMANDRVGVLGISLLNDSTGCCGRRPAHRRSGDRLRRRVPARPSRVAPRSPRASATTSTRPHRNADRDADPDRIDGLWPRRSPSPGGCWSRS